MPLRGTRRKRAGARGHVCRSSSRGTVADEPAGRRGRPAPGPPWTRRTPRRTHMEVTFENGPAFTVAVVKHGPRRAAPQRGRRHAEHDDRHADRDVDAGRHPQGAQALPVGRVVLHEHVHRAPAGERDGPRPLPARRHVVHRPAGRHLAVPPRRLRRLRDGHRPRHQVGRPQGRVRRLVVLRRQVLRPRQGRSSRRTARCGASTCRPGEQYTVDSGHLVAWHEAMPIEVHKVGGSSRCSSPARASWSRSPDRAPSSRRPGARGAFVSWLVPYLPKSGN